jgi:hypothetical protein
VAALATLFSLIWLIPFTGSMMHYPLDFIISIAWFAAFGALYEWIHRENISCSGYFGVWSWDGGVHNMYCYEYQVAEGLALVSGVLWLLSAFVVSLEVCLYTMERC